MHRKSAARAIVAAAPLFAALGDETRLAIVARLCASGPLSIARLTEGGEVTRQAVTKHLHVLSEAGVVRSERDGRENVFRLEPKVLADARRLLETISTEWDDRLDRLKRLVES